jgi:hypothetical protein
MLIHVDLLIFCTTYFVKVVHIQLANGSWLPGGWMMRNFDAWRRQVTLSLSACWHFLSKKHLNSVSMRWYQRIMGSEETMIITSSIFDSLSTNDAIEPWLECRFPKCLRILWGLELLLLSHVNTKDPPNQIKKKSHRLRMIFNYFIFLILF